MSGLGVVSLPGLDDGVVPPPVSLGLLSGLLSGLLTSALGLGDVSGLSLGL
jgi:hypothetical protein